MSSKTNRKLFKQPIVELWYQLRGDHLWLRRVYEVDSNGVALDVGTSTPPEMKMHPGKMFNPTKYGSVRIGSYVDENESLNYIPPPLRTYEAPF